MLVGVAQQGVAALNSHRERPGMLRSLWGSDASRPSTRRRGFRGRRVISAIAALSVVAVGSTLAVTSANAAGEHLSMEITTTNASAIQSGAQLSYQVTYECSSLASDPCTGAVLTVPRPTGIAPDGSAVAITSASSLRTNTQIASTSGVNPIVIKLNPLAPGTTGEIQLSWATSTSTTPSGTIFSAGASFQYADPSGSGELTPVETISATDTLVYAVSGLTAVKQMVTPAKESDVQPDSQTTYRVYACNPTLTGVGGLKYNNLTLTDTLPAGTVFNSATGGGVYNAGANTITWTLPDPVNNSCGSPSQTFEVTVTYPSATFVPAAAAPPVTNKFVNKLDATATAMDGKALSSHAEINHAFLGPVPSGTGQSIVFGFSKNTNGSGMAVGNTNIFEWSYMAGWRDTNDPGNTTRLRSMTYLDRMPCVSGGTAISPLVGEMAASDAAWTVPADQCTSVAFDMTSLHLTPSLQKMLEKVEFATWDGTTARIRTYTMPAPTATEQWLYMHTVPATGAIANSVALNLPDNEQVTDMRTVLHGVATTGTDTSMYYQGRQSQAFINSGLTSMTNTVGWKFSGEYAAPQAPAAVAAGLPGYAGAIANFNVVQVDPQVSKVALANTGSLKLGDTIPWRITVQNGPNGSIPLHPELFDVLPVGLELDPASITWTNLAGVNGVMPTLTMGTVTINGVEHQKLMWTWPNGETLSKDATQWPTVTFNTKITLQAHEGTHSIDESQTAVLKDSTIVLPDATNGQPSDEWDLDGNGNTTERVAKSAVAWTVLNTSGAGIEKFVKGELDADWTKNGVTNPQTASTKGFVDYKILMTNQNAVSLTDMVAYDVLPVVGDTAMGQKLAGQSRGTQWDPTFVSMLNVPVGMTVQYSTSANPCRPELFGGTAGQALPAGCDSDWSATAPSDPAKVTGLRFVMAGKYVDAGGSVELTYRMQAPKLTSITDQPIVAPAKTANNNVAWSTSRILASGGTALLLPAEAPVVTVRQAAGYIGDFVWEDTNRNGIQDPGEPGVEGVIVKLLDADGNPVLDTDGKAITTTTDADGKYEFIVPLGDYKIEFDAPAGREFSPAHADGSTSANDSDAVQDPARSSTDRQIGVSDVISIKDPVVDGEGANINTDIDAGLITPVITIVKDDHKQVVLPGESLTYDLTVSNLATASASTGVVVTDKLPANVSFVSATDGGTESNGTVTWNLGTLAAQEVKVIHVTVTVAQSAKGNDTVTNVATLDSDNGCTDDPSTPVDECSSIDVDYVPAISVTKTDGKTIVKPGEELVYTITATNSSDFDAPSVTVQDTLPANVTFKSADNAGTEVGGVVSWDLGTLAAKSNKVVTVTVTVNADVKPGDKVANGATIDSDGKCWDDPATPQDECNGSDIDDVTPPISIVKDDHKQVVLPGESLTYDLTVTNGSATIDATGVIVTDTLPVNTTFVSASDGGTQADGIVTWNLGGLAKNESKVIRVTVTVNADVVGNDSVTNVASITSDNGCLDDPTTDVNECTSTDIDHVPAISVTKTDGKDIVEPGEPLVYTIMATNSSDFDAPAVTVKDTLPANVTYVSADNAGAELDGVVTWEIGTLAAHGTKVVTVTVTVNADVRPGETVLNGVVIDSDGKCWDDPSTAVDECNGNDTDEITPPISIVKDDHRQVVLPGEELTYDLTVANGSATTDATGVVVTDTLPANTVFVSASDGGTHADGVVTWNLGTLAAGETRVIQVTVTVANSAVGNDEVRNIASITSDHGCVNDPETEVDECNTVDVDHVPAIKITKTDGQDVVKIGQALTYTLTATNTSDYVAPNVTIKDTIPAELEPLSTAPVATVSSEGPNVLEWSVGDLAPGESVSVTVTARVREVPPSTRIVNTATVDSDGQCWDDPSTEVNECESTDIDRTPAKVWILKDDNVSEVAAGDTLTYDITVGNDSAVDTATDVVVSDVLPSNLTFVSATDGGTLSADGKTVVWNLADLEPGARVKVQITAVVGKLDAGDKVSNIATVTTPDGCEQADDCTSTDTDYAPDLLVVKSDGADYVTVGSQTTYDITATNRGDGVASAVVVTDVLPEGLDFVSAADGGVLNGRTVTWNLGDLAPGETRVVHVTATVNGKGGDVVNTATVTGPKGCLDPVACSSTDTDEVGNDDQPSAIDLPNTGAEGIDIALAGAALLLAAGGALLLMRRKA